MKHTLPVANWTTALADLIRDCADGDTIAVSNEDQKELGERAKARMCPGKSIAFEIETSDPWIATTNMKTFYERPDYNTGESK